MPIAEIQVLLSSLFSSQPCSSNFYCIIPQVSYGDRAFMRLQLEILKKSDDYSIYAWKAPLDKSGSRAIWPTAFIDSDDIVQLIFPEDPTPWILPMMTIIGLEMRGRYPTGTTHTRILSIRNTEYIPLIHQSKQMTE
jgi:hypothetical protein